MSNICRFYIVRHGQTEWNNARIIQGQLDSPLTEEGIRQAAERSKTFKDIEFADAFASDLFRAHKTAEIIAADHTLAVKTNQLLRERSFGSFDGKHADVFYQELRELLEHRESLSEDKKFAYKLRDDIESDQEVCERMITFLRETAVAYPDKNVLVVAHGGIMRALLFKLGFGTYEELGVDAIDNLGYVVVESDGVDFFVKETQGIKKKC